MKTMFIALLLVATAFGSVSAQTDGGEITTISMADGIVTGPAANKPVSIQPFIVVDTSFIECVYEHIIYDPVKDKTKITNEILEVGPKASRYSLYGTYQRDSVVDSYSNGITFGEYMKISKQYGGGDLTEQIKDRKEGLLKSYDNILEDKYYYDEPIPHIDWVLTDEKEEVCGHDCLKAIAHFRGRDWTVWYAPDLTIDDGPLKFCGLPGFILKVEDDKKEHIIEAIQLRESAKPLGYRDSDVIKTDRKKFNKMMEEYKSDVRGFMSGSSLAPTNLDGSSTLKGKKRRLFYNPVEKD